MEEKKRKGRGPGKKNTHRVSFCVSCQPEERKQIKDKAKEKNVTVSELVITSVLCK